MPDTIRTLWVVPRIGTRSAELLETPIMVVVSIIAARWAVVRLNVPFARSPRLMMGFAVLRFFLPQILASRLDLEVFQLESILQLQTRYRVLSICGIGWCE